MKSQVKQLEASLLSSDYNLLKEPMCQELPRPHFKEDSASCHIVSRGQTAFFRFSLWWRKKGSGITSIVIWFWLLSRFWWCWLVKMANKEVLTRCKWHVTQLEAFIHNTSFAPCQYLLILLYLPSSPINTSKIWRVVRTKRLLEFIYTRPFFPPPQRKTEKSSLAMRDYLSTCMWYYDSRNLGTSKCSFSYHKHYWKRPHGSVRRLSNKINFAMKS